MYSSNGFKFRAVSVVMLVLNSSEEWRVKRAQFSSFVYKNMFSGVSLTILQSQFIKNICLRFVVSSLKRISSEDLLSAH
jgi:hypothetical protein